MRLSISARIFGGYLVILTVFGGVMGYTLHRMQRMRQSLHLVNSSYLSLTLILAELHNRQGNLVSTMEEWRAGRGTKFLGTQIRIARRYQMRDVRRAMDVVKQGIPLAPERGDLFLRKVEQRLMALTDSFHSHEADLDKLFGTPAGKNVLDRQGAVLLRKERKLATSILRLRDKLRGQVRATAMEVEVEERRAIWATVILVGIALLVSLAVTIGARLTLRPLRGLVAGTKRLGSGDYSHRVVVKTHSELGDLAREFNNMAAAIDEREQRLLRSERLATAGRLASHITHEIRNPLSSISLNTELLQEEFEEIGGDDAAESLALCQAIRKEVDRLTDFTEEYLRFSRLPKPRLEPEDVHEVLLDLLSFTSSELEGKGVTVCRDLQAERRVVQADENQLRQAFLNLVRNAGEAMANEGGELRVSSRAAEGQVVVCVADNGPGIEAEALPEIFEPFFSTKDAGTGLGLALTQQIVQEHGGAISVDSEAGVGTTFTVRLPLYDDAGQIPPVTSSTEPVT